MPLRGRLFHSYAKDGPSPLRDTALGFHVADDTDPKASVWAAKTPVGVFRKDFDGLVRRLLHAMMTNAEFKLAVNGHSVSAGHDNNFWQSYIHQFHHVSVRRPSGSDRPVLYM